MNESFCAGSSTSSSAARRIALMRHAELVDLVEQEHRVLAARLLHALRGCGRAARRCTCGGGRGCRPRRARRRARCGRTCGPSRGRSTSRSTSCRRRAARRTAGSGPCCSLPFASWCTARNSSTRSFTSLEAVVILVEDARGLRDIEVLLGAHAPRQLRDRLEVRADHLRLHRLAADARRAAPTRARPPCAPRRAAAACRAWP